MSRLDCDLEELTSKAKQIQDDVLNKILKANANTEYLRRFLQGSSDKELFKKNVPVVSYEDVKPYIDRVANGESSDIISGNPITAFFRSSGTSSGNQKIFPANNMYYETIQIISKMTAVIMSKYFDGFKQGKVVRFTFIQPISTTPCGLPLAPVITSFTKSEHYSSLAKTNTSPDQIILCPDTKQRTMAQYIPALEFYSNKLPLVCKVYASSEAHFGLNLEPLSKPQHVSYTFLPNMSYFEFIDVDVDGGTTGEIVDLVNVKLGRYYETLVTNFSDLHRCRVGDVLQVTGFYNMAPQFRFVSRKHTVLSVYVESTTEEDLLKALARASVLLEPLDLMFTGFTCYADISTIPGHYVIYMELKAKVNHSSSSNDVLLHLDDKVLVECCCVMEESLNGAYRLFRSKDEHIGALEIRVVQQGAFDSLMVSRGASLSQYKTPTCINSAEALTVLEDKVLARFFSDKSPPDDDHHQENELDHLLK